MYRSDWPDDLDFAVTSGSTARAGFCIGARLEPSCLVEPSLALVIQTL